MQSLRGGLRLLQRQNFASSNIAHLKSTRASSVTSSTTTRGLSNLEFNSSAPDGIVSSKSIDSSTRSLESYLFPSLTKPAVCSPVSFQTKYGSGQEKLTLSNSYSRSSRSASFQLVPGMPLFSKRCITTLEEISQKALRDSSATGSDITPRIKFKRLDKTARHIMQIIDKEAVEEVREYREIPDIKPGYIVQLKVEVPENKRRVSILKGIVIARRNAGISTTFRIRRLVAGVGVESLFLLYSPNIKEIKVLDKKKVRRAKLYYLRDKMNALKKQ